MTKEKAIQMIQNQGLDGARALFGIYRVEIENYHLVVGLSEASISIGLPTENSWMIIAIQKDSLEMDIEGKCKSYGALTLFLGENEDEDEKEKFATIHDLAYQTDYQGSRVWFYAMD